MVPAARRHAVESARSSRGRQANGRRGRRSDQEFEADVREGGVAGKGPRAMNRCCSEADVAEAVRKQMDHGARMRRSPRGVQGAAMRRRNLSQQNRVGASTEQHGVQVRLILVPVISGGGTSYPPSGVHRQTSEDIRHGRAGETGANAKAGDHGSISRGPKTGMVKFRFTEADSSPSW